LANEKNKAESINLADVTKQVEAMLAEAKKAKEEAEKLLAEAKASIGGELTEEQKKAKEESDAYWNEYVEIELFKDNNKYKDDVPVGVNGEICLVKRGEKVKIKRKFAAVLENSKRQDIATSEFMEQKAREFAESKL
jgi:hypothetical protein